MRLVPFAFIILLSGCGSFDKHPEQPGARNQAEKDNAAVTAFVSVCTNLPTDDRAITIKRIVTVTKKLIPGFKASGNPTSDCDRVARKIVADKKLDLNPDKGPLFQLNELSPITIFPDLKELGLQGTGLTDDHFNTLKDMPLPELEQLDISNNPGIRGMADVATFAPILITLRFNQSQMVNADIFRFDLFTKLEELSIRGNMLPAGPRSLPSTLKNLDLAENLIQDANELNAASFLDGLAVLNLSKNLLSDIPEIPTSLALLDVSGQISKDLFEVSDFAKLNSDIKTGLRKNMVVVVTSETPEQKTLINELTLEQGATYRPPFSDEYSPVKKP